MTEEEGENHLKDWFFHGLRHNIHNVLCYMYGKPDSQYSKLVMTARKAKTETPGGDVSETQPEVSSSEPS